VKIGLVDAEIFDEIRQFFAKLYLTFTNEPCHSGVTELNCTKFSHDTQASFSLLMRTARP